MIVVIAGCDGAGKSTVTRRLTERLTADGLAISRVDKWDIYDFDRHPECRFLTTPLPQLRQCISEMSVPARTLFLFWSMHTTMARVSTAGCDVVLIDSYWTKHAASEILYGAPGPLVDALARSLPAADLVFVLDTPPGVAWARKARDGFADVVPYECGMDETRAEASFLAHQTKLRDVLLGWSSDLGWGVVDGTRPPDDVAGEIAGAVLAARKWVPGR
jgi:dTMP kinase